MLSFSETWISRPDGANLTVEDMLKQKILIVGYGDIGHRVGQHYTVPGQPITAVCRQPTAAEMVTHIASDLDSDDQTITQWLAQNPNAHVYWFAPPQKTGLTDQRIRRFCEQLSSGCIKRLVYISTTAVYGDCQGRWIDENEPLKPGTDRGRRRQDAEICLQKASVKHQFELAILRVPGIYGPGRWPLTRLKKGLPVLREEESPYTNRIHQDDLARICVAAMNNAPIKTGEWQTYNCSDGQPSTMTDYFNRVADGFGISPPPQVGHLEAEQQLSSSMMSFMLESKRVRLSPRLTRIISKLDYPSLDFALKTINDQ